jgi:gamma-polyglutamate synthase
MPFLGPISACLLLLVGLGLLERLWRNRAWKAVPIRVHVNGTRGKSSVTRLIWASLRAAGIPALAKTTGAAACLLLPDGTEQPVRRRGKPNIREQLRTLWLAKRTGARAVVLECMAIAPELQWTAEQDMMRATIGVITNARTDHTEAMGHTWDEIAASLANTIPRQAVLIVGEPRLAAAYQRCASGRGSKLLVADIESVPAERSPPEQVSAGSALANRPWQRENQAIALAVTRELGIAGAVAIAAMRNLDPRAGDAIQGIVWCGHYSLPYLDARKANDPESFLQVWAAFLAGLGPGKAQPQQPLLIYNHRSDRPHRLLSFGAKAFPQSGAPEVLVTGQHPAQTLWRALRRMSAPPPLRFVSARRLPGLLAERAGHCCGVVFCGNIHGLDLTQALRRPNLDT